MGDTTVVTLKAYYENQDCSCDDCSWSPLDCLSTITDGDPQACCETCFPWLAWCEYDKLKSGYRIRGDGLFMLAIPKLYGSSVLQVDWDNLEIWVEIGTVAADMLAEAGVSMGQTRWNLLDPVQGLILKYYVYKYEQFVWVVPWAKMMLKLFRHDWKGMVKVAFDVVVMVAYRLIWEFFSYYGCGDSPPRRCSIHPTRTTLCSGCGTGGCGHCRWSRSK